MGKDVLTNILARKFLTFESFGNFSMTCKDINEMLKPLVAEKKEAKCNEIKKIALEQAIDNTVKTPSDGVIPENTALSGFSKMFDHELELFFNKEIKSILAKDVSKHEKQKLLLKSVITLLLVKYGYNRAENSVWHAATNAASQFLTSEQGKKLTENNQNTQMVGRLAFHVALVEAYYTIAKNSKAFIENLYKVVYEELRNDIDIPFKDHESFIRYLAENRHYQRELKIVKEKNATHFIVPAMEIIKRGLKSFEEENKDL